MSVSNSGNLQIIIKFTAFESGLQDHFQARFLNQSHIHWFDRFPPHGIDDIAIIGSSRIHGASILIVKDEMLPVVIRVLELCAHSCEAWLSYPNWAA